jgi:Flp pilus assembly pilin Flp
MNRVIAADRMHDANGQTMVEYSLVLGVCVACVVTFTLVAGMTRDLIDSVLGFFS